MEPIVKKMNGYSDHISVENDTKGSLQSARIVVPILFEYLNPKPRRVVDFGCARGAWLKACQENGVESIQGLDGPYLDRSKLVIDSTCFKSTDLSGPLEIEGEWDMAICVEVAEHLPQKVGPALVRALTRSAPLVLFSAAVPGQTGRGHINEQWPIYWKHLFEEHGFSRLDPVRRHIWQDNRVEWWYRQNIFLYVSESILAVSEPLRLELEAANRMPDEWVHVHLLSQYMSLRGILRKLPGVAWHALKRRIGSQQSQ